MEGHDTTAREIPRQYLPKTPSETHADVYVQSLAPSSSYSSQERLVERLKHLVEQEQLTDLSVTVWGEQVCTEGELSTVEQCSQIIEAIGDFFALAADSNIDISPFFRVKEVSSSLAGETFTCISTPARCLAFADEDGLLSVFPCRIDGTVYRPEDAVARLETIADIEVPQQPTT